jgi:TonB family protein
MMLDAVGTWMQTAYILSVVPLGLAWALTALLARRTASTRHHVWVVALTIAILAPATRGVLPSLNVPLLPPREVADPRRSTLGIAEAARPETFGQAPAPSPSGWPASTIAALVWIVGGVPLLSVRTQRRRRLLRLVGEASAVDDQTDVRSHARVSVPMLAGVLRPTILLPMSAADWPVDAREAVLAHERAHLQRHDHVTALVSEVATIVYWLNPLAWIAAVALEREREAACDEAVLRAGIKPSVYAAALLRVAQTLPARRTAASVPSIAGGGLDARIRTVLHRAPNSGRAPLSWRTTIALIGVCALLVGSVRLVARTPHPTMSAERPTLARGVAFSPAELPMASLAMQRSSSAGGQTGTDAGSVLDAAGLGSTEIGDFCCPDYLVTMIQRIRGSWARNGPGISCRPSRDACRGTVRFTIQRDGAISKVSVEKRSGYRSLDTSALTAVRLASKLPPLPAAFPKPTLTVHFRFAASSEPATPLEFQR